MKIAVYAISKNESKFVKRFCESSKNADLILIADTGSTDGTVQLAKKYGATVYDICISPWRFDKARDAALALVPRDIDVCISLDLDEVLEAGWREEIERVWTENTTRMRYKFDWSMGIVFFSEKIHARHGYHWHHPCHEYPMPDPRTNEVWAHSEKLLVSHHPDPTKSRSQYLPLLEVAVKEDKECPRNAFYYARELTFVSQWEKAIKELKRYLELPRATWADERCYAMRLLSKSYDALNNDNEAIKWARLAVAESHDTREPWLDLSVLCYKQKNWLESYSAAMNALAITHKREVYTAEPSSWKEKPYDYASIAAWNLGLKDQALTLCKQALEFNPSDKRLLKNMELINGNAIVN
jgi:tetratricopeptide (TPR) repeat protein